MDSSHSQNQWFVPFSETLIEQVGIPGRLVPFQLEYQCVRLLDGTYEFSAQSDLQSQPKLVHAA